MQETKEEWRDIENYIGKYQVSNFGNVRSMSYNRKGIIKELTKRNNGHGYLHVCFIRNGKHKYEYVHRLVANAFIGNIEEKMEVNHIDYDKSNNNLENLEILSKMENYNHSRDRMYCLKIKRKVSKYKNNELICSYDSITDVKKDDYSISKVCQCCRNQRKTHKGFEWKYIIE